MRTSRQSLRHAPGDEHAPEGAQSFAHHPLQVGLASIYDVVDARARAESCGAHFREEFQTAEGEAMRNDEDFCHVSAWEFQGDEVPPVMHKETLEFESVELATRSYK